MHRTSTSTSTTEYLSAKQRIVSHVSMCDIPNDCHKIVVNTCNGNQICIDPKPFTNDKTKELAILKKAHAFFNIPDNFMQVANIVNEECATVSLRILDYLVTTFAKKYGVAYTIDGELVGLFSLYKSALRAYSKRSFDAFCRRDRILFQLDNHPHAILTTHAQLNFLMWAVRFGVISYAVAHRNEIENDMARSARIRRQQRREA